MVRGTALLVALPLLVVAFTVGRPAPLPGPSLPPAFDTQTARTLAADLADRHPDRSPGSAGALGSAHWFSDQMQLYGFRTQADVFTAEIPGVGEVELRNLVAVARGPSPRAIVFMAHRDNEGEGPGANDNASGTAALIELARAYAPVAGPSPVRATPAHTIVFVSTDGGAFGALGAARFAETYAARNEVVAVVSLDAIAGTGFPRLELAGDTPRSPAATLVRTAAVRILEESGDEPHRPRALRQLVDLGFPFALGEQGPLVARGIPAITITTVDEDATGRFGDDTLDAVRLGEVGRATQSLLGSLDGGLELAQGTTSYVYLGPRIVRGWAIQLALVAAIFPFLIGAIDLFARCRRRRIRLLPAVRSLRSRLGFWAYAAALFAIASWVGLFPDGAPRPIAPHTEAARSWPVAGLAVVAVLLASGWLVARERLLPRRQAALEETLAGHTIALLALGLVALAVVATNPFALVFLLPSLYAWLWLPQFHAGKPWTRGALFALGLSGPGLLVVSFADRYGLGIDALWYVASLVSVGYVPWIGVLVAAAWAAVAGQLAALAAGRYAPYPEVAERPPRGPIRGALRLLASGLRRAPADDREALEA